jgi:hypothetical protein
MTGPFRSSGDQRAGTRARGEARIAVFGGAVWILLSWSLLLLHYRYVIIAALYRYSDIALLLLHFRRNIVIIALIPPSLLTLRWAHDLRPILHPARPIAAICHDPFRDCYNPRAQRTARHRARKGMGRRW